MAKPPLPQQEVERIVRALEPLSVERRIVLVGGQAVAFWMRFLGPKGTEPGLLDPLTSKDIDFEGSARAAKEAAALLVGEARLAGIDEHTPNTGVVTFVDSAGHKREIDFIDSPLGLRARDVRNTAIQLVVGGRGRVPVWVMHPERRMESRIYNADLLGKTQPLARRQLDASILCARVWSRVLIAEAPAEREPVRAVLRLNERVFRKCLRDRSFRNVLLDLDVDPFAAVLVDDDRLPDRFRSVRYPQMVERLTEQRTRDRRNRQRAARSRGEERRADADQPARCKRRVCGYRNRQQTPKW